MFVEAEIVGRELDKAFVLPRSALRGDSSVFIVDADSYLHLREVEILRIKRNEVIIVSGLDSGDLVCLSVLEAATDGTKVRTGGDSGSSPSKEAPETRSGT